MDTGHRTDLHAPVSEQLCPNRIRNFLQGTVHESNCIAGSTCNGSAAWKRLAYNRDMERKIFWAVFIGLGLIADFLLPVWWAVLATIPILFVSWWVAYRSEWF
jgi:hypothetical protein